MCPRRSIEPNSVPRGRDSTEGGSPLIDFHVRERLQSLFIDVLSEPIPARLAKLLDRIAIRRK